MKLNRQEINYDDPDSNNHFVNKPFVATPAAIQEHTVEKIQECLRRLQVLAQEHDGLDYLQVFEEEGKDKLWIIEDGEAVTALLPSDY